MNTDKRRFIIATAIMSLLVLLVSWFHVIPNHAAVTRINDRIDQLEERSSQITLLHQRNDQFSEALDRSLDTEATFKAIPGSPGHAELMRRLSMNIRPDEVIDQTFTAGRPSPVKILEADGIHTMPLTVEMVADFPSIFSLIRTVESQDRLVRISSLRIDRIPDERSDNPQSRLAEATIQLDAIYASQPEQEGAR